MYRKLLCLLILLSMYGQASADNQTIRFGLFPYVNPAKLIEHHKSFVDHLQTTTGRKIQLVTSPDYKTFLERTENNQFDIILTAPHFGRLAEKKSAYQRIAMTMHNVQGIYLVKADSSLKDLTDIEGKNVTIAAPTSILYRLAVHQLSSKYGMVDGKNISIIPTGTHNNAMLSVIKGESEVAVTGIKLYQGLIKRRGPIVRKIGMTKAVPGFMLLANKTVSHETIQKLQQSALSFSSTSSGKKYIFRGYKEIDDDTMKMLDRYTNNL